MRRPRALDVMTPDPVTVTGDTPAGEVARILAEKHISGVPVVNEAGQLIGIVTEADLLVKALAEEDLPAPWNVVTSFGRQERRRYHGHTAADVMSPDPVTVPEDTPVSKVAQLMLRHKVNRLPVVREGHCVGIVTRNDVLKVFERTDDEIARELRDYLVEELWIDPYRLRIQVENGVVTLRGEVPEAAEVDLVTSGARTPGVTDVDASRLTSTFDRYGRPIRR
ncbi:MAG TPA: CBS domain-containing protein [Actinomycetota bacterium]|nr:CBS domain-containing protein [Actinomycetota bacterium]